jgi:NADP-dependent 3-hydroxy acid dehydrogenase YdfG
LSSPTDGALEDAVVVVTGGARGLGEATVRTLCDAGATAVIADVLDDLAAEVVDDILDAGGRAQAITLDLRDARAISEGVRSMVREHGKIDALVNNAGTDVTVSIEELEVEDWDRVVDVNLRAPFLMSKAVFPIMKQQRSGHIVNVTSTAAKRTWANAAAYHASKWGLLGLSHALHVEARSCNVKVTAVVAGGMRTPFLLDRFPDIDQSTLQDPRNVAETIRFVLTQPAETVIPEVMVLPMQESSWP